MYKTEKTGQVCQCGGEICLVHIKECRYHGEGEQQEELQIDDHYHECQDCGDRNY